MGTVKTDLDNRLNVLQDSIDATAAGTITNLITVADGLTNATPGAEFFTKVKAARDGYEDLSGNQKSLVTTATLDKLVEKEKSLVFSSDDFVAALADNDVDYIVLGRDFGLQEYIGVEKAVVIEGNGKTLTLANQSALHDVSSNSAFVVKAGAHVVKISDLTIDITLTHDAEWSNPMYIGLQVTDSSAVNFKNITLKGGHAGLYLNNSTVVANAITTSGNTLGGIGVNTTSTLTTNGTNNNHTQPTGKPDVWSEGSATMTGVTNYTPTASGVDFGGTAVPNNQTYYKK